jgi:nucleoid-associated protein YgaU
MLDDFRQEKPDQNLDPLSENTSFPLNKKIALICILLAIVGLFVFLTSDSWSSSKDSKGSDDLAKEIEQVKLRVSELEQMARSRGLMVTPLAQEEQHEDGAKTVSQPQLATLKSLIEQELQEPAPQPQANQVLADVQEPQKADVQPEVKKQVVKESTSKNYTVQKGDTLSKISQKFYGTPKRWRKIVEANKDKLGNNQILKPGMSLHIPSKE